MITPHHLPNRTSNVLNQITHNFHGNEASHPKKFNLLWTSFFLFICQMTILLIIRFIMLFLPLMKNITYGVGNWCIGQFTDYQFSSFIFSHLPPGLSVVSGGHGACFHLLSRLFWFGVVVLMSNTMTTCRQEVLIE